MGVVGKLLSWQQNTKDAHPKAHALYSIYMCLAPKSPSVRNLGSFSMYEQPKWERIVASTQVGFRVRIWVRIRIRVWIRVRVRIRVMVRVRFRLGLYFGCSYIEKGPKLVSRFFHTLASEKL